MLASFLSNLPISSAFRAHISLLCRIAELRELGFIKYGINVKCYCWIFNYLWYLILFSYHFRILDEISIKDINISHHLQKQGKILYRRATAFFLCMYLLSTWQLVLPSETFLPLPGRWMNRFCILIKFGLIDKAIICYSFLLTTKIKVIRHTAVEEFSSVQ